MLHHSLYLDGTSLRVWSKRRDVHARLVVAVSLAFVWSSENVQMSKQSVWRFQGRDVHVEHTAEC